MMKLMLRKARTYRTRTQEPGHIEWAKGICKEGVVWWPELTLRGTAISIVSVINVNLHFAFKQIGRLPSCLTPSFP